MHIRSEFDISSEVELRRIIKQPSAAAFDKVESLLTADFRQFIALSPFILVATSNAEHQLDVSPKGDKAGFVRVVDEHHLVIPERKGNRLAFGFHNILQTGSISLIFMIPGSRETLRVNGQARLNHDPKLLAELAADGKPALLATLVSVEQAFFHCGKAVLRSGLWQSAKQSSTGEALVRQYFSGLLSKTTEQVTESFDIDYRENL